MAHGIVTEGVVADRVLIEGDKGWHGLGENRDKITPEDVRKAFPWEYEMESVQTSAGATVPNFKAVTSEGNPIGIVGDGYTMRTLLRSQKSASRSTARVASCRLALFTDGRTSLSTLNSIRSTATATM
jgi:hypothetical protein